jgi:uncharacterized protein YggE
MNASMTMPETDVLRVSGSARVAAVPDEVEMTFEIEAVAPTADAALQDANGRLVNLQGLIAARGIPDRSIQTQGMLVQEHRENRNNRWVHAGYRATSSTRVRLTDFTLATPLMVDAVRDTRATVYGPEWHVSDETPVRREALKAAAADARAKAEIVATAFGRTLGPAIRIREGASRHRPDFDAMPRMMMQASMSDAMPESSPGELPLSADVTVTFQLQPVTAA